MKKDKKGHYRFQSIVELKKYFSEYLSAEEMEIILIDRMKSIQHLEGERMDKAHMDFIQSCAEAMKLTSELKMIGL